MSELRIGELCAGYGGLGMGVSQAIGGHVAWYSEIDKGALKILEHRFPDVPNIGDMTAVNWADVPPVEILTAGYPCQPFSHAGKRKGTNDERHLWPYVREAIRGLRPRLTVLENVAGHRSLGFDRVLGDLAEDGMHVAWVSRRASDVGAAHQRERLFIGVTPDPDSLRRGPWWPAVPGEATSGRASADPAGRGDAHLTLLGTPTARDYKGSGQGERLEESARRGQVEGQVMLLPTPAVNDMGAAYTPDEWDAWTERMKAAHNNGNGHGKSLNIEAQRSEVNWGKYEPAIRRWESVTRPAPEPTEPAPKGGRRLSARFDEWHMGLPDGWITDVPGITWREAVRACGNGVVPQQAASAVRFLLDVLTLEVAA